MMGGDIRVHSELGRGSVFTVRLPRVVGRAAALRRGAALRAGPASAPGASPSPTYGPRHRRRRRDAAS